MQLKTLESNDTIAERRSAIYATSEAFTVPSEVNPTTPLEALNLNWRERDLPENERTRHVHRLHPYLGKFIPQIVEIFLRKYFSTGQTVLDPFCGSGTTLIQANELGINSIGYDVSAFNVLLCRAKGARYNIEKVRKEALDILEKVRGATQCAKQPGLFESNGHYSFALPETDSVYLHEWFAPSALKELLTYRDLIESGNYENAQILKIILSRSARSSRLTTHFDLDFPKKPQTEPYHCYKHSRECSPTTDAFKFLDRYTLDTIARLKQFDTVRTNSAVEVHHQDSRFAKIPPINGVITSPPYVGLIDYHEQHAYSYHLLGLQDKRQDEIGPAAKGSSVKAKQAYQSAISAVFSNAMRSMPSGGRMIVVAGDRANLYDEIARMVGVEVEAIVQRHVNRRTGRRSTEFYESVFVWRKP